MSESKIITIQLSAEDSDRFFSFSLPQQSGAPLWFNKNPLTFLTDQRDYSPRRRAMFV
ncbi:hypothetical protein H6F74_00255 [Trichocoleus sp. FACHB-90]|uniref:hypothetical protein n=1 Tax=Trichocoleus sp. FACHB-90 TaxID=2692876 RepID=UPI00168825B1|nr:hypothetical protein [Trichocoleus sp. FACHB-90]MBD1924725.1 hypothetical protein [Trichocoleus sp. FACHB-90]